MFLKVLIIYFDNVKLIYKNVPDVYKKWRMCMENVDINNICSRNVNNVFAKCWTIKYFWGLNRKYVFKNV